MNNFDDMLAAIRVAINEPDVDLSVRMSMLANQQMILGGMSNEWTVNQDFWEIMTENEQANLRMIISSYAGAGGYLRDTELRIIVDKPQQPDN